MEKKFGVNTFINEVHIKEVDFVENFKSPEYQYIVEIYEVNSHKGNGLDEMKIYTNGKLEVFIVGNWKISPIVQLPYDWGGHTPKFEMIDNNQAIVIKKGRLGDAVYRQRDYTESIKWYFSSIREMERIQSANQLQLLDELFETCRILNIYLKNGTDIANFNEFVKRIKNEISQLKSLKEELTEENYQITRIKLNANIDLFNSLNLKLIND